MKRKGLSKKVRFEVLKRDAFKCQYCGCGAPDVLLEVDHIQPVSKGGQNEIINLITSCHDCNSGKSDRELSDGSAIEKQRAQLEELNLRREQLEMMLQWREGMKDLDGIALDAACDAWVNETGGVSLNGTGIQQLRPLLKKHGLQNVLEAIEKTCGQYLVYGEDGNHTHESVNKAFNKLGGILRAKDRPEHMNTIFYIRGILRNRVYVNEKHLIPLLVDAYESGVDLEYIKGLAKTCSSWTNFINAVTDAAETALER